MIAIFSGLLVFLMFHFIDALNPVEAKKLYLSFNEKLRSMDFVVEEGVFGAHMDIELLNDGPCTIIYEF